MVAAAAGQWFPVRSVCLGPWSLMLLPVGSVHMIQHCSYASGPAEVSSKPGGLEVVCEVW